MPRRISGRELLLRMSVWLLICMIFAIGLILNSFDVLSADGLTRLFKVTAVVAIPLFVAHQLALNRKKRKSPDFGNVIKSRAGDRTGRISNALLTIFAIFMFFVSVLLFSESIAALFVAYRIHTAGQFHGMPMTARHGLKVAADALIMALVFLWGGYASLRFRRPKHAVTSNA